MTNDSKQIQRAGGALNVSDDNLRAIHDRMSAAKARIETALRYVMFAEMREELRNAQSDLAVALAYLGK